jgi:hypothetical protein
MSDDAPKSAIEIAMARLRQKDVESGETETPLTGEQKAAIAEARQAAAARLAQEEIMLKAGLSQTFDPEARAKLQDNYRRDVQRINDDRDRKIAKIRAGSA